MLKKGNVFGDKKNQRKEPMIGTFGTMIRHFLQSISAYEFIKTPRIYQ